MKTKKFYPNYFTFPAVILFIVFYCVPIIAGFFMSFTDWHIKRLLTPKFVGFKNFVRLFGDEHFILALKNTVLFAVVTTIGIVIFGLLLALLLNSAVKGKAFFRTIFYLPAVLSLIVIGIMFSKMYSPRAKPFFLIPEYRADYPSWNSSRTPPYTFYDH